MPLPASVKCAIFDLDGTLLDSLEDLADSANAMLHARGYPIHDVGLYRHFVGDGALTLVRRILPEACQRDDSLVKECLAQYSREYAVRWNHKSRPYNGIPELLQALADCSIRLAVLSNKAHPFTLQCVRELCPAPPGSEWAAILGLREGALPKPDPSGVHEILKTLQISPSETIYFGDTSTDMKTAVAAAVYPIGVLWGFRNREELEQSGAKTILAHPTDLVSLLSPAIGLCRPCQ